jgi:Outer membrane protein and related peptidoglycan-associated (lipo)proteins
VRGHTDAIGSVASNQVLSERRATAIRTYLTGHGVQARDVASVGLGSSQPVAEERTADGSDNPEGRRFNRRAEIVIRLP